MNLPTEIFGDVIVVHTPQEVGCEQSDELEAYLGNLERTNLVVDLDGTEQIDSRGLTALLNAQDKLRELDGDIKIATANANNRKIFEITRLDKNMEVFDSVVDAVRSFR